MRLDGLKTLAQMNAAVDDLKAERAVCELGGLVIDQRIGRHLAGAMSACPFFRSTHQGGADATAAMSGCTNQPSM